MCELFISYVQEDSAHAASFVKILEKNSTYKAWHYERDCKPGVAYPIQCVDAIKESLAFVLLISPRSIKSKQMTSELMIAHECGREFFPILIDITHEEFQEKQKVWRYVLGASTSVAVPADGIGAIVPQIIDGLARLGIMPTTSLDPAKPPVAPVPNAVPPEPTSVKPPPEPASVKAPPIKLERDHWTSPELPVLVVAACSDAKVRQSLEPLRAVLARPLPMFDSCVDKHIFAPNQSFSFRWHVQDVATLPAELDQLVRFSQCGLVVIVSDALAANAASDPKTNADRASPLTRTIRDYFADQPNVFCGLVSLVPGEAKRTTEIDRTLNLRALQQTVLKNAVTSVADGLRLEAPPGSPRELLEGDAVVVQLAKSRAELEACLHLRYLIYGRMGYLSDALASCPAELELDDFDGFDEQHGHGAIHLVAKIRNAHGEEEVIGTARLVFARSIAPQVQDSIIGSPPNETLRAQSAWIREIRERLAAADPESSKVLELKRDARFATLPILQGTDFRSKNNSLLESAKFMAELSRVVVAPLFRGSGVSKLLIRTAIAIASDLKKQLLLLECVPSHVGMYEKYGFETIPGTLTHAHNLDQRAVAMKLLPAKEKTKKHSLASSDLQMIRTGSGPHDPRMLFGAKHLCLCLDKLCWSTGRYDSRLKQACPLLASHQNPQPSAHESGRRSVQ